MARKQYGYAESSNLKATTAGHIFDVVQADTALENGMLKKLDEIKEVLEVREVKNAEAKDKVVLILSTLIPYDTSNTLYTHESYLRKEAGEVARAYELVEEDRFAVADYMIKAANSKLAAGNFVVLDDATGFYQEVAKGQEATKAAENGFMARIEGIETKGAITIVRLRVIQNTQIA